LAKTSCCSAKTTRAPSGERRQLSCMAAQPHGNSLDRALQRCLLPNKHGTHEPPLACFAGQVSVWATFLLLPQVCCGRCVTQEPRQQLDGQQCTSSASATGVLQALHLLCAPPQPTGHPGFAAQPPVPCRSDELRQRDTKGDFPFYCTSCSEAGFHVPGGPAPGVWVHTQLRARDSPPGCNSCSQGGVDADAQRKCTCAHLFK
jgi:hypothetical protein